MNGATRVRDLRLVPLALFVWGVALVCVFVPQASWWCAGLALVGGLWTLFLMFRRGRTRARGGLGAVIVLGMAAAAMTAGFAVPQRDAAAELDGRVIEMIGEITSSASVGSDGRLWFDVQSVRAGALGSPESLAVPMRVGVEPEPGFDLGAVIRVTGDAMATDAGERAAAVVFGMRVEILQQAQGVFGIAARVREDFVERATRLPEPGAGLLPGLAVGDTRAVSEELGAAMLTSGLSHLTAVSGANCAIVVGAVFWLVGLCGGGRGSRVVLALTALTAFVVLVTPEPSVIRASVMAALAMLTLLCGRPSAGISVLCLAVTGILVSDPWLATTPGFALSAAATAALIVLAPPLARGMSRWMPQPLALAVGIPVAAQLACGPIIALFAEQQSIIGIPANMLADPAAPIATVVGLLACLAAPIPPLADLFAASAWLPAAWIATTATVSAAVPGGTALVVPGIGAALLVAVLSTAIGVVLAGPTPFQGAVGRWSRPASFVVLVIAGGLLGARLLLTGPLVGTTVPDDWSIAACDVGQGDGLVVRSEGRIALIDTGMEPEPIRSCLSALGIERIDLLILTHFDADHVGAAGALVGRVDAVLHGPVSAPDETRLLDELHRGGAEVIGASTGMQGSLGRARWRVLWPRPNSAALPAGNDASVVVEFDGGGVPRSLFLGDLSAVPQRMLAQQLRGAYAVVKVAHHGSADQDPALYAQIRARIAIFSAGIDNDYGHPRQETIALTEAAGALSLRTDLQGRILIGLDDDELVVWTERADAPAETADVDDPE
ncbi:ComEC/Rec2 family competence protein [Microbacterium sp. Bi121]|uniref:ComEC/Rec2 family competence protein n=1 Tax=Microbacterium sp. Bi121 TaxID=2822348 RepID=UPI001DACA033|nr:ComEC/Rec2 family competence protein [Microbacterium sp. Bi121]CAH0164030.1 ComE operon protein 3 [Microbacterium sp. Bi121]